MDDLNFSLSLSLSLSQEDIDCSYTETWLLQEGIYYTSDVCPLSQLDIQHGYRLDRAACAVDFGEAMETLRPALAGFLVCQH